MLRAILCVSIVAAFPLESAAASRISEDIPIPGGTVALARAIGLPSAPDRPRFIAELARVIYETPEKQRQDPDSIFARLRAHVETAGRLRRALAAFTDGVSLARAANDADRVRLKELLDQAGLRLRESRGRYSVEIPTDREARQRAAALVHLGVDVNQLAAALNAGDTVTPRVRTELVPLPLTMEVWSRTIFNAPMAPADLFAAIVVDERAALLCHGLAALDDPTLQYLVEHPAVLQQLHLHARVFAAFGSHLKIRDGRIVTAAYELGARAVSIWESLVGVKTAAPDAFIAALFERHAGRLAYLYDLIAELDPPRAAFALGLAIEDPQVREVRARALLAATSGAFAEWPTRERPFSRPLRDTAALLLAVDVNPDGTPRAPAARLLWSRAFESTDIPEEPARLLHEVDREGLIDAAWLAEHVAAAEGLTRMTRLNQLAFGYRVFGSGDAASLPDTLVALRALPKYRAAMLGLEQMGIRRPEVYATVARQADRISRLEAAHAYLVLSQFQGALALISRLTLTGSIDRQNAESLVLSLAAVPLGADGRYRGGIAAWLRAHVVAPRLDESAEGALLAALAGRGRPRELHTIQWEGETYRIDLVAAEESRLRIVRARQAGYTLDDAFHIDAVARRLADDRVDIAQLKSASVELQALYADLPPKLKRTESDIVPGGAEGAPDPRTIVDDAVKKAGKINRPKDMHRASEIADDLFTATDVVLAEVLASVAYAASLGDPDGPTLLGGDVARRHDFGIGSRVSEVRVMMPWAIPEPHADPGLPWHVAGSLIGLDVALAQLSFRRVSGDTITGPPTLSSNDRETFARSVGLLNAYEVRNEQRDAITQAVDRGRERVNALRTAAELDAVADAIRMDGWRRRALVWTLDNQPARKLSFFSLTELLMLGGASIEDLDGWGAAMTPLFGCLCMRMPAPNTWRFAIGRPQVGLLGTAVPDMTLRIVLALAELDLPAALAKAVLDAALPEYLDTVRPTDPSDWLTLVRGAQEVSRERIEDYVAAAAVVGGPLVPVTVNSSREP
jgi:hypothetical protein